MARPTRCPRRIARLHMRAAGARSSPRCPVEFSRATAGFKLTPIRRTSPVARINSISASRKGEPTGFAGLRAAASAASVYGSRTS